MIDLASVDSWTSQFTNRAWWKRTRLIVVRPQTQKVGFMFGLSMPLHRMLKLRVAVTSCRTSLMSHGLFLVIHVCCMVGIETTSLHLRESVQVRWGCTLSIQWLRNPLTSHHLLSTLVSLIHFQVLGWLLVANWKRWLVSWRAWIDGRFWVWDYVVKIIIYNLLVHPIWRLNCLLCRALLWRNLIHVNPFLANLFFCLLSSLAQLDQNLKNGWNWMSWWLNKRRWLEFTRFIEAPVFFGGCLRLSLHKATSEIEVQDVIETGIRPHNFFVCLIDRRLIRRMRHILELVVIVCHSFFFGHAIASSCWCLKLPLFVNIVVSF